MNIRRALVAAAASLTACWALAQGALPFVDAEVKKLDAAKGTVVLNHKDIPNLGMAGMQMQFDVADRKLLAGVKPGDKVKVTIDMVGGKPTVLQLKPVK